MITHNMTTRALGLLLAYPDEDLVRHVRELSVPLREEQRLSESTLLQIGRVVEDLATSHLLDLQERYTSLFDRGRSVSLHLFEHIHGEARARGQAMVSLLGAYQQYGYSLALSELPDYLPALCEFLSVVPEEIARGLLVDVCPVLSLIHTRLLERDSAYAAVLAGLLEQVPQAASPAPYVDPEQPTDDSLDALDAEWSEQPVTFGEAAAHDSCGSAPAQVVPLRRAAGGPVLRRQGF
jgi:nitrate reductase molybdenum cofactor assembly chaperone NarJ/NarW